MNTYFFVMAVYGRNENEIGKYKNIQKLTREVLVELVNTIYVHEGGEITVELKYRDAFEDAVQYIEKNKDAC